MEPMILESRLQKLEPYIESKNMTALLKLIQDDHPADIAAVMEELAPTAAIMLFRILPKDLAAEVFAYLDPEAQQAFIEDFTDHEISNVMQELYIDDAVDVLEELPASVVTRILKLTPSATRETINRFLKYPEDSAGSLMTAEYTRIGKYMTVREAIAYIRRNAADKETIYTCYITAPDRTLTGVISIRTLLLAKDDDVVGDIMEEHVIKVRTGDDKESVMKLISEYDLLSIPVVDAEDRLVGIITVDDAMDVAHEEATEDMERMAAIQPSEKSYFRMGVFEQSKNRIVWLMILMISGMINGSILEGYEHAFLALPILVSFIPMLTDTGGNSGSQSATMIIRGMALDDIHFSDLGRVIWKELRISLVVGILLGALNFIRIIIFHPDQMLIALTVSGAMVAVVIMSKLMGCSLPILAQKLKMDPAIMAAPLITTIVDAAALVVYFSIARLLLPIG